MTNTVAFILLKDPAVPDITRLAEVLRAHHPNLSVDVPEGEDSRSNFGTQGGSLLRFAGMMVSVMSVGAPLPRDEGLITRASASWPEAPAAFQQSTAHLIVAVMGQQDQPLATARVTTAVAGALVAVVPDALGVIWGGGVASPAQYWAEKSKSAFAPFPHSPSVLWVSMHPFRDERTGGVGVLTYGLNRFVEREVELIGAAADLRRLVELAGGLAGYLVEKGPVLKDGSTFGISETERMPVRLCTSERFPGLPVISGSVSSTKS